MFIFLFLFVQSISMAQTYTWDNVNLQGMGYVTGIAIHPTSYDKYVRTDVGGIYRWDSGNSKWLPVTDGKIASYNVEGMALSASNANVVFIAVGDKETGKLYKSTDKGNSWQQFGNFSAYVAGNDEWRNADPRLVVDDNNNGNLMFYASRKSGLQKSTNGGLNWISISSSVIPFGTEANGGQNFVVIDKASGNSTTSSTTVYVGVAGKGVYKSTNGGTSFSLLSNGPTASTYTPVAGALGSNSLLFVTYCRNWNDGADGKVYRFSTAGSGTNITPSNNNGMSFGPIDVCDSDPNKIITYQWRWGETKGIHYSADGGTTWTQKTCLAANFNAPVWWDKNGAINWDYCGGIAFDPTNSGKIWFTSGHGVFTSENITATNPVYYTQMKGLEEMVIMQICVPPLPNSTDVFIALADQQGFTVIDRDQVPAQSWSEGQFGMASSIDYCVANPNFVARVSDNEQWTNPTGYGKYSTNGGVNWSSFSSKPSGAASGNIAIAATNQNTIVWAPINSSNNGLNVLPYYTYNGGGTWTKCGGIPTGNNFCSQQWSQSKFLVSDRVNGNKFYYYSYDDATQRFYRSTDGGKNFSLISTNTLPGNWQMKMEAIPGKEGHLLFCAASGSSLYYSANNGDTWTTIPNVSECEKFGFGKAIGSSNDVTIFVKATINGVNGIHYSTNNGTSWINIYGSNIPSGLADISGDLDEEYTVYFGTGGRGLFYGTAQSSFVAVTGVSVSPTSASLNVGATQQLTATVAPSNATNKTVSWSSSNTSVATVNSSGMVTGVATGSATITVTTQDGNKTATSVITVTTSTSKTINVRAKMMWESSSTLELWLNNVSVKTWTISGSTYADYTYTISGSNNIKVYFPDNNDTDVQVDYIEIDGIFYQSENQAVNTSVWQDQCGGSYAEQMNCTGYIDFGTIDASGTGNTWVELSFDNFETGWGKWTSGGNDCSRYTGATYAHQGSAALDIQDNSGVPSSFYLTNSINVTAYDQLKVSFWFYAVSMESNEDFFLEYYNGTSWQIVATYISGSGFANKSFQYKEVIIDKALHNFPANASLRFRCDASNDNDDIYIDEIRISVYNDTSKSMDSVTTFPQLTDNGKLQFNVYPNPVNSLDKTINIRTNQHFTGSVQLVDEAGRVVYCNSMDNDELSMNLSKLRPGFYIVQLSNGQKNYFSKLIVR
jgi:hypothetical protein